MKFKFSRLLAGICFSCVAPMALSVDLGQLQQTFMNQQRQIDALMSKIDRVTGRTDTSGNAVTFNYCHKGHYQCTPRECITTCKSVGKRMATRDEVFTMALRGENVCSYLWMTDGNKPQSVFYGYPMYNYQGSGCANTNNTPILADLQERNWNAGEKFNCACAK